MSADLLRRAAALLRERGTAAQHREPWCSEYLYGAIRHVQRNVDRESLLGGDCPTHGSDYDHCSGPGMYDGPYVALMHPPVALALAESLESFVLVWERDHEVWPAAMAVARAILREDA
jgi:hypothetical protein